MNVVRWRRLAGVWQVAGLCRGAVRDGGSMDEEDDDVDEEAAKEEEGPEDWMELQLSRPSPPPPPWQLLPKFEVVPSDLIFLNAPPASKC